MQKHIDASQLASKGPRSTVALKSRQAGQADANPEVQVIHHVSLTISRRSKQASQWRVRRELIALCSLFLPLLLFFTIANTAWYQYVSFGMIFMFGYILLVRKPCEVPGCLAREIRMLCSSNNIQAIGPLLEAWGMLHTDTSLKDKVIDSLTPLLAQMRAGDGVPLTDHQRSWLRFLLSKNLRPDLPIRISSGSNIDGIDPWIEESWLTENHEPHMIRMRLFALAALHTLAEIGTGQDVRAVQRLADGNGLGEDEQVCLMAQACLPLLQARADEARSSSTYLRASEKPNPHTDVLLRVANSATATNPHQLLHAAWLDDSKMPATECTPRTDHSR